MFSACVCACMRERVREMGVCVGGGGGGGVLMGVGDQWGGTVAVRYAVLYADGDTGRCDASDVYMTALAPGHLLLGTHACREGRGTHACIH
jgi:hypothetical protein